MSRASFAFCNELYGMLSPYEVVDKAAGLGYKGLELAPFTLSEDIMSYPEREQKLLASYARDRGVELMGMHWLLRSPLQLHLTAKNLLIRKRTYDFFLKIFEIAANTGARMLTLGSPKQRSYDADEDYRTARDRAVELFSKLVPVLEAEGLVLSLEPLETEYTNFITRTAEAVALAEMVGSKSIGVTLDTHFLRWETETFATNIADVFRIAGARLTHLHIQDDNRKAPGMGSCDFSELITAVAEIDWDRYLSIETFISKDKSEAEEIARLGIEFLKKNFS